MFSQCLTAAPLTMSHSLDQDAAFKGYRLKTSTSSLTHLQVGSPIVTEMQIPFIQGLCAESNHVKDICMERATGLLPLEGIWACGRRLRHSNKLWHIQDYPEDVANKNYVWTRKMDT